MKLRGLLVAGLLAPLFLTVNSARAAAVTGEANIAGNVSVNASSIVFNPTFVNTPGAKETGSFEGLTGGTIMSLFGGPATGPTHVPGFIHFTTGLATPVTFDLTYIAPGVGSVGGCGSTALGSLCTPKDSPFTLLQLTSNTVVASLQLNGNAYTGSPETGMSHTVGVFSTQTAVNGTVRQVVSQLEAGQSISGITYSASFAASPVPEPGSMLLMGLGLTGAGVIARRKASKKA